MHPCCMHAPPRHRQQHCGCLPCCHADPASRGLQPARPGISRGTHRHGLRCGHRLHPALQEGLGQARQRRVGGAHQLRAAQAGALAGGHAALAQPLHNVHNGFGVGRRRLAAPLPLLILRCLAVAAGRAVFARGRRRQLHLADHAGRGGAALARAHQPLALRQGSANDDGMVACGRRLAEPGSSNGNNGSMDGNTCSSRCSGGAAGRQQAGSPRGPGARTLT